MKPIQVPIPQRDEVTARQLATLLQTAATLYPVLLNREPDKESNNGSALEAAEATFIKICDRIDGIIDDGDRWSLNAHRALETQLAQIYDEHTKLIRSQQSAVELLGAPHTIHKPSLMRLDDGTWLAILGSVSALDNAICATGDNPALALMAWDMVFTGQMQSQKIEVKDDPKPAPQPRKKKHGK